MVELAAGLAPGQRYRCGGCGNVTRFDVESVERVRRYWHADLAGVGAVEEEERIEVTPVAVTCRWCGATDAIEVVDVPGSDLQ
ncbi:MAG: hypothetical protein WD250_08800 [Egibacteraceae bacterium]